MIEQVGGRRREAGKERAGGSGGGRSGGGGVGAMPQPASPGELALYLPALLPGGSAAAAAALPAGVIAAAGPTAVSNWLLPGRLVVGAWCAPLMPMQSCAVSLLPW